MIYIKDFRKVHELREMGMSWNEIIDEFDWFTDNTRKEYKGWCIAQDEKDDSVSLKHAKKSITLKQKAKEISLERSVLNELVRDISVHKTLTNQVIEAIKDYNPVDTSLLELPFSDLYKDKAYVFTLGDLHYNGDYTLLEQLSRAFDVITQEVNERGLEHIYLLELGDLVDGNTLRKSQLFYVKSGMISQVVDVAQHYVNLLRDLMSIVNVTFISVDSSNHTQIRNLGTKQNELVEEDVMIFINKYIEVALPQLHFIHGVDVTFSLLDNFTVFVSHGHLVRSKEKYIESLQSDRGIIIDYAFFGHYHHQRSIDLHANGNYDKKVFYVPTLNSNEGNYERDKNLSSQPGIGMYVFDNVNGNTEIHKKIIKGE